MITPSLSSTEVARQESSQGTVSTIVIGLSVLMLGIVVCVIAINDLAPVVWQMADIILALRQ